MVVYSVLCTVYCVQCTVYSLQCTVYWGCETSHSPRLYCSKIISEKHYKSIVVFVRVTFFFLITVEYDHAYIKICL